MNLLARPSELKRAASRPAAKPFAGSSHHYFAFLSYSHRDAAMARWLHEELERFRVPSPIVGKITDNGTVPRRLAPIFRDLQELPASGDLGTEIRSAIAASQFLIVLCSPDAAKSHWTNAEIEAFKRARPEGCAFAAIVSGEPFASDMPGREHEECLPEALRFKLDRRGRVTSRRAEPLAADLREPGHTRRLGFLKLVAGMLGVGLDELVQRETIRRQRRLAILTAASLAGMVVTSGLAVTAIQARDAARDQRREAEGLVGFMLGDLRAKLEPLGRLDVLDSVGVRALGYYEQQDKSSLSDESLAQRSKALTLMGEIANMRGDLDRALRLYREAYSGTAEALRRDPGKPERLFDHAQNVFWVGYIDHQRGRFDQAESYMREYQRLAQKMVASDPANPKWQMEQSYADSNLGVLLLERRKFGEAATIFARELRNSEAMLAAEPGSSQNQDRLLEALAWLADAREAGGGLDEAIGQRERQIGLVQQFSATRRDDAELKRKLMNAERALGRLFASRGDTRQGLQHLEQAVALAAQLMRTEPNNTDWSTIAAASTLELGELQLATRDAEQAGATARAGCDLADRLAERDASVVRWRADLRGQCLKLRARLALARGAPAEAQALADEARQVARAELGRTVSADTRIAAASADLLRGDVAERRGDPAAAARAYASALAAWPQGVEERPRELATRAYLLDKAGKDAAAADLRRRLAAIGYRQPQFGSA